MRFFWAHSDVEEQLLTHDDRPGPVARRPGKQSPHAGQGPSSCLLKLLQKLQPDIVGVDVDGLEVEGTAVDGFEVEGELE